jgi:hypothetical protein
MINSVVRTSVRTIEPTPLESRLFGGYSCNYLEEADKPAFNYEVFIFLMITNPTAPPMKITISSFNLNKNFEVYFILP